MSERTVEGTTTDAVDSLTIKQKEIISMQLQNLKSSNLMTD